MSSCKRRNLKVKKAIFVFAAIGAAVAATNIQGKMHFADLLSSSLRDYAAKTALYTLFHISSCEGQNCLNFGICLFHASRLKTFEISAP
jgi:hypothetical protein